MRSRSIALLGVVAFVSSLSFPRLAPAADKEQCVAASESAQKLKQQSKLRAARKELLVCAQEGCPAIVQKDCVAWLAEVDASLPTVVLAAKDPEGKDLVDVRVLLDGELLTETLDGTATPVDPGPHTFRFESKDGKSVEEKVLVKEGERNRTVAITIGEPAPVAPPPPVTTPPPSMPPRDTGVESGGIPTAAWILGGVGVVALGSFAYFGLAGRSQVDDLRESCAPACAKSDEDAARTKLIVADVSLGVGLVSLGVATWMFVTAKPEQPKQTVRLDAVPVAGGGVAIFGGTF